MFMCYVIDRSLRSETGPHKKDVNISVKNVYPHFQEGVNKGHQ